MNEEEWLKYSEPTAMLRLIREWASQRKVRLFACGCCRASSWFMSLQRGGNVLEVAELWADGLTHRSSVRDAADAIDVASDGPDYDFTRPAVEMGLCAEDPYIAAQYTLPWMGNRYTRDLRCANLIRCVIGNPFDYRPPPILTSQPIRPTRLFAKGLRELVKLVTEGTEPLDKLELRRKPVPKVHRPPPTLPPLMQSWLTSDVLALARQMYESRDFSAMPILADALQDAGCDNPDVLNHCREPGVHVRGCWVVDLVLGKA